MENLNPKLVVIITPAGIESVTVHAMDVDSRRSGYNTCMALESAFRDVTRIVKEIYGKEREASVQ